jgi:hypothetical protein
LGSGVDPVDAATGYLAVSGAFGPASVQSFRDAGCCAAVDQTDDFQELEPVLLPFPMTPSTWSLAEF